VGNKKLFEGADINLIEIIYCKMNKLAEDVTISCNLIYMKQLVVKGKQYGNVQGRTQQFH